MVTQTLCNRSASFSSSILLMNQFSILLTWNDLYLRPPRQKWAREVGRTSITDGACAEAAFKQSRCHVALSHEQRGAVSYDVSPLTARNTSGTINTTIIWARSSVCKSFRQYLTATSYTVWLLRSEGLNYATGSTWRCCSWISANIKTNVEFIKAIIRYNKQKLFTKAGF